jgi:hypothetical protein
MASFAWHEAGARLRLEVVIVLLARHLRVNKMEVGLRKVFDSLLVNFVFLLLEIPREKIIHLVPGHVPCLQAEVQHGEL